jgi:hypothetical protein
MSDHHKFSPSQLMYREACPGWQPDEGPSSVAAAEGTMMHKALETGDYSGLTEEQKKCVDMVQDLFDMLKEELSSDNFKRA